MSDGAADLDEILELVRQRRQIDFTDYRRDTLASRLQSRLQACGSGGLPDYRTALRDQPDEVDRLVEALLVPVTSFFRDPLTFRRLAEFVLPALVPARHLVRAWVIGAATGEEAFSVAFLLAEAAARQPGLGFEVLASDLHRPSLEVARAALYPDAAVAAVPPALRSRYLLPEHGGQRVCEEIRARVRFVEHDLVGTRLAPPEAVIPAFEIVLCRNVLLYFGPGLRAQAARRLSAVVAPRCALVLGAAEALPEGAAAAFRCWPGLLPDAGIFQRSGP